MPGKAKLYTLILIMAVIALSSSLLAGWMQYEAAIDKKKNILVSMVKQERSSLENKLNLKSKPNTAVIKNELLKNLRKHIDEDLKFNNFGDTGEFVLARVVDKDIVFLLANQKLQTKQLKIKFESTLSQSAEPMRRALMGVSGSMIGKDYKGNTVLAAYESLGTVGLGLVAKIDLSEIKAPFLKAGLIAAIAALVLMALGAILFYAVINPILIKARANEEHFRKLYDQAPVMMHSIDQNGRIQYANRQWLEFLGYSRNDVIGKKIFDFQTDESKKRSRTAVNDLVKHGKVEDVLIQLVKRNGEIRDALITAISQQDDNKEHIGSLSVITDVTEKLQAEKTVKDTEERFQSLFQSFNQGMIIHRNRKPLYANQALVEMYGYNSVDEILALESTLELVPEDIRPRDLPSKSLTGKQSYDKEYKGLRKDGTEFWIDKHVFLIDWKGERATCSLRFDITDKKEAEDAVRASEEKFRSVFDSVGQGILIHRNRKPLYANQAFADMYGYESIDDILSLESTGVLTAPEYLGDRHFRRIAGEDLPIDIEIEGVRKDGDRFWIDKRSFRIMWEGEPAMCSIRYDITDRKKAEEAVLANEKRFRTLFDSCNIGIIVHKDNKPIYANKALADIYGYDSSDDIMALESSTALIAPGSPRSYLNDKINEDNYTDITLDTEYRGIKKDGSIIWINKRTFGIMWNNEPVVCSFRNDITLRKKAEESLQKSELQFRTFVDTLPMAVNVKDTNGRYILVNTQFEQWYGKKSDYLIGKTINENYGDDEPELTSSINKHDQEVMRTGKQITQFRKRIIPDGRVLDLEVNKFPIFDETGNIIRIGSITADITERKKAEEALRESENQFRTFTDQLPIAISIKDLDGRYIFVNKDIEDRYQIKNEDLIGKTRQELFEADKHNSNEVIGAHEQEVLRAKKQITQFRTRILPDGKLHHLETSKFPILDEAGNITRIGSISSDITERKEAEEALRLSELRFRGAIESMQDAFALYDADDRLVVFNDQYLRLHPNSKHMMKPGMRFEDMIRHNVMSGINADAIGREEEHIKERLEHHQNPKGPIIRQLTNGTWFIINESRTPDGGYSVTETDITELKSTEFALRESEERFRKLFNTAPQGIMVFRNYKALYANQALAEMYGYESPEDILALESTQKLLAPEYRRDNHKRRLAGENIPADEEYQCLRKDGSRFWVEKRSFIINWDGEIASCTIRTDIDQRKKAEAALRDSEERFRMLFNSSPQGILVHRDHKPLYANAALADMYGYASPDDILNLETTSVLIGKKFRNLKSTLDDLKETGSKDLEYRGVRKDGEEFWVQKRSFVINWDGEPAICSMRSDVTEPKEANEKIRRSEEQFRVAIAGLQEGFALYDADDRLVIYNDEFVQLHPGAKDVIRPGMKWSDLLEATLKSGMNAQALGREDAYRKERTREHKNPTGPIVRQSINGTWRIVNEAKLPDGGSVTIQTDITKLKQLESEAISAQSRLLSAIESIEGGFSLYGPDGRLVLSNTNNQKFFKDISDLYKPGIKFEDILQARVDRNLIDGIDGNLDVWVKNRLKRFNQRKPSVHLRKDRNRWMQINEYPTSDGGKAIIRTDITDSKTMTDALVESEERFKTLVDSSNQGIIIHRNNKPLYANSALAKMFGYKSPKNILELTSIKKLLKPAKKTNGQINVGLTASEDEILTAKRDGAPIWVNNTEFEIDWEGKTCTCTTLFDITERKTAETQLVQASKLASLGELASSVAHELNQPLSITRIVAESTMMKAEEDNLDYDYLQKQLGAICDQSERMANITNHLRLFSRMDEGEVNLFDPAESINNAYEFIEQPFLLSGIKLTKRITGNSRPVIGSSFKLEQVILNLLNNAADAVNDQLERMDDEHKNFTPRISISLSDNTKNKDVIIRIRDNGGGIDQENLDKIFDPFFTTKQAEQGTGLGLSISYGIVQSMQGELSVSNDKNGALFTIKLPAQPKVRSAKKISSKSQAAQKNRKSANGNGQSKSNGNGKRNGNGDGRQVLVVDDEQLAADSIAEHLEHFGYQVLTANNGAEALMICDDTPPDIVITDLRMPVMNGFELIRELRAIHPKLPIIVTTGHANLEEEEDAVTDGASAVLWKPIRLHDLTDKLTELVN